jgi:hypothetical protein
MKRPGTQAGSFPSLHHGLVMRMMVVVAVMMTGLSRQYHACKDCESNDREHQITNLHGEILLQPGFTEVPAVPSRLVR